MSNERPNNVFINTPLTDGNSIVWASDSSWSAASNNNLIIQGGTGISYQIQQGTTFKAGHAKRISPKLYFSYVKSKLTKTQLKKLKPRLTKLQRLINSAQDSGQTALYEELSKMLMIAIRESEAYACGYDVTVNLQDVTKFMGIVRENDNTYLNPIFFKKLEDFPRSVPAKITKIIKSVQSKGLFDELWVLYLDYSGEQIKSNKEKIREKDPVLFGKFNTDPNKLYFIADWIDEYCDLTLSKFIDTLKESDAEYDARPVEDMTVEYIEKLKKEVKDRQDRLSGTNRGNFQANMEVEDELKRLREENAKLREEERFRAEDKEIAIERALQDRREWRDQAREESEGVQENLIDPLPEKPWYKKLFGF